MATYWAEYKLHGQLVIIRTPEPEDAPALIALVNQLDTESIFLSREPGEFAYTEEQERTFIQTCKDAPNRRILIAEVVGRVVAMSTVEFGTGYRRFLHAGGLGVAVAKACWSMGIGRVLMEENVRWLSKNGVKKVNLTVDTQNFRAISLYQKLGFVVEGKQRHDRKLADGSYRDSYWMGMFLPDECTFVEAE